MTNTMIFGNSGLGGGTIIKMAMMLGGDYVNVLNANALRARDAMLMDAEYEVIDDKPKKLDVDLPEAFNYG